MKSSKRMKKNIVVMHQHQDKLGRLCGALHPVDADHKKVSTQKRHEFTIKRS